MDKRTERWIEVDKKTGRERENDRAGESVSGGRNMSASSPYIFLSPPPLMCGPKTPLYPSPHPDWLSEIYCIISLRLHKHTPHHELYIHQHKGWMDGWVERQMRERERHRERERERERV